MRLRIIAAAAALLTLAGCAAGPNYKRPQVAVPPEFHGAATTPGQSSLADLKWNTLFNDETLHQLVATAIRQNLDLKAAAERVLQARSQLRITGSQRFPELGAGAGVTSANSSVIGASPLASPGLDLEVVYSQATLNASWELDVWGRIRRLTESARAQYLASEEARRAVLTSLIGDVMTAYFNLRELDMELDIAVKTRATAERGLQLVRLRKQQGAGTGLDVRQAEQLLYTSTTRIAAINQSIGHTENTLNLLLGQNPGPVPRGKPLSSIAGPAAIPAGLPSALLGRRPDIRQAEQTLIAANAAIGAARALYFPQISLTGYFGGQSRALSDLLTEPARFWSVGPSAALPLFNAGRIRATVKLTEAEKREAVVRYQQAIQSAFRDVSDALIANSQTAEERKQQQLLVDTLDDSVRLSTLRYKGGLDSYLPVLDAERNLFTGQLVLAQLRRDELLSVVSLYRSLGGGWQ
ncbi:MAG: efflux transporter outer membrane subunit [Bryobacterales bacterium]|nr:efflux transporter outer membrane subunit [Bryobacterales bacterium]